MRKKLLLILLKMAIPNLVSVKTDDDMSCSVYYNVNGQINNLICSINEYEIVANYHGKSFSGLMDQINLNS